MSFDSSWIESVMIEYTQNVLTCLLNYLQTARLARISNTKSRAIAAFNESNARARQLMEFLQQQHQRQQQERGREPEQYRYQVSLPVGQGQDQGHANRAMTTVRREDVFRLQHHHLLDCLQKTTVSEYGVYNRTFTDHCRRSVLGKNDKYIDGCVSVAIDSLLLGINNLIRTVHYIDSSWFVVDWLTSGYSKLKGKKNKESPKTKLHWNNEIELVFGRKHTTNYRSHGTGA